MNVEIQVALASIRHSLARVRNARDEAAFRHAELLAEIARREETSAAARRIAQEVLHAA